MRVGFADEEITPPEGRWDLSILGMAGAVLHRVPKGVDEPLFARAVVLEDGGAHPRLGFVHFTGPDGAVVGTLLNYALHSTIPSEQTKSGYWPGYPGRTCLEVERRLGGEAAHFTGACGNIHNLRTHNAEQASTRLADAVSRSISLARAEVREGPFRLRAARRTLHIPKRHYDGSEIDVIRRVLATRGAVNEALVGGFEERLVNARAAYPSGVVDLDVQAIAFGDVCIVAVPGELFVEFGIEIKAKSTFRHTYVVELAHEYLSYIPTPHALMMGGYQTWSGVLCHPTAGQVVVDGALELVRELVA